MKKIAYIELDTHAEIAGNFMELMMGSKAFKVDYYFSEKIIKQIGKHHSNIHLSESTELLNQLNDQQYDLIIIGTAHRYFNLFKEITAKYNTSIIVHNLNFAKITHFQLFKNIFKKDFRYRLKLYLKEDLFSAPDVFKKAKKLLVLDQSLVRDDLQYLPVFFNQFQLNNTTEIFTIVIPGEVSQSRRDYKKVLQQLKSFKSKTHFKIIFLGKADGKELRSLKDFSNESSENISIQYFIQKVPQQEFDEIMQSADVLWCPIQKGTEFFSNKEIYGETKMSGNVGDAIKYGKVAIFPTGYDSEYPFLIPERDEVEQQILNVDNSYDYNFHIKFNRQKVSAQLEETLKILL